MAGLVKKIDAATIANRKKEMGSFVIFLSKSEEMEKAVKEFGDKNGIKDTVLALDAPSGPRGYGISKEASVTILLYVDHKVKANFVFAKGKMTTADVDKVMKELPKILAD